MRVRFPLLAPRLGVRRSWRAGADCKSVVLRLRWFESTHSHQKIQPPLRWFYFLSGLVYGIRPYKQSLFGSTTSRFRKHSTPKSLRLPRRHIVSREPPSPTKKFLLFSVFDNQFSYFFIFIDRIYI